MKHIKRVKSSIVTLMLEENTHKRLPVMALYFIPLKEMAVVEADERGTGRVPSYMITGLRAMSDNIEDTMVELSFAEVLSEDSSFEPKEYVVHIPIHTIALAQALVVANENMNLVVINPQKTPMTEAKTVKIDDLECVINFPDPSTELYGDIKQELSRLVETRFTEPMYPESVLRQPAEVSGMDAVPAPLRRSQMALMPLISSLADDNIYTLKRIMDLEETLNNFHLRNHNEDGDVSKGDYNKVIKSLENKKEYDAPEIPEELKISATLEYSVLDNMTDALEDHFKNNRDFTIEEKIYYQDISLLVLINAMKSTYKQSQNSEFITAPSVSEHESFENFDSSNYRLFNDITDNLQDVFDSVTDKIELTEEEKDRISKLELWGKSPKEYWPSSMSSIEKELKKSPDVETYFDIMTQPYETHEDFRNLVDQYGLGKVFTAFIVKTSINLSKFTEISNSDREESEKTPFSLIATQWITQPSDGYMWELPAMSYALANYDVATFVSLLTYTRNGKFGYGSMTTHGLALALLRENWDRENFEYLLVEHTGMPEKYRNMLLLLIDELHNVEIDDKAKEHISDEEELFSYVAIQGVGAFLSKNSIEIHDAAHMVAYAIPALADIHVNTNLSLFDEETEDTISMGSIEWKRHRVAYIEGILDSIASIVERRII